jgi:UPF0755 protein
MLKRVIATIAVLMLLAAGAGVLGYKWLEKQFVSPGPATTATRIKVEPGATVRGVLTRLGEQGVIADARNVSLFLRVSRYRPNIKAGTYEIPPNASPQRILTMLEKGEVVLEQFTVIEGTTFADLRKILENQPSIVSTLKGKSDAEVMAAIGRAGEHPEGRFFPDTYRFAEGTTDVEILTLAYNRMQQLLDEAWSQRKPDLPIKTPYEALILASIIEKETGIESERPQIAGVFTTRLRKGMRLQSDPTVIYGLGDKYDGDIRTRDLSTDTPYNTYTRSGLPPTPIALPGRAALFAAVKPDETGALYFVALGDGTGAHYFSKTLQEHNEAVRRYLARLREQRNAASQSSR